MKDTYMEMYFHFVWATKGREEMITSTVRQTLYAYIQGICREHGICVYALGAMPDHVHLACDLPTTLAVADFVKQIKGGSAHLVNHSPETPKTMALRWQPGYGALTLNSQDLKRVISYIENQETHHRNNTLLGKLERCSEANTPSSPAGTS
jgi:putative transposase